jgi:hypothetical protein
MTAGRAVLNDEIGNFLAHLAEEFLHAFEVLAQPFTG